MRISPSVTNNTLDAAKWKGISLSKTDLRLIGQRSGTVKLFDGRKGIILYPYVEFKERVTLFDGTLKESIYYEKVHELFPKIRYIYIGKRIIGERRKEGEILRSTGKGYRPCRYRQGWKS